MLRDTIASLSQSKALPEDFTKELSHIATTLGADTEAKLPPVTIDTFNQSEVPVSTVDEALDVIRASSAKFNGWEEPKYTDDMTSSDRVLETVRAKERNNEIQKALDSLETINTGLDIGKYNNAII